MTALDFLDILIHIVFISLGVLSVLDYLRHKNEIRRDVALMFGILAIPFTFQLIARIKEEEISAGAQIASVIALVLEPYLLLRLVRYLQSMPAYMMRLVSYSMVATIIIGIVVGDRNPLITTLVSQGYLIGFNLYAMIGFARGVSQSGGVRQKRLRFAAAGSGLFALIFIATLVSNVIHLETDFALLLLEVLTGACVITYYIAFAPPRWLRQTWQLNELHYFLHQTSMQLNYDRKAIFGELSAAGMRAIGGISAVVAGCDPDGSNLRIELQSTPTFETESLENETGVIHQAWQEKKAFVAKVTTETGVDANRWANQFNAQTLFIIPITGTFHPWGMLIIATQYAPLFPDDDLDLLTLLVRQSAIQLDYSASIQELRISNQSLEQRVSERTNELKTTNLTLETQIDEFKQAQQQIEYQAYLLENVNDAVIGTDQDSIIRFWNSAAENLFGWSAEETVGRSGREILQSEFPNTDRTAVMKILAEKGRWKGDSILRHKDGSKVFIESSSITLHDDYGSITGYVSVNRDIGDRKKGEEALRISEERYRSTLDTMLEGGQIIDFDWRYRYVNKTAADQGHQVRENLIGHTMMEIYPGIENTELFQNLKHCMVERVSRHMENEFSYPDGTKGWFELSIQPVQEGIFILSMDITERKQVEEEIHKLNIELEQRVIERTVQLKETNVLMQTLMDHLPDHIYFKDLGSHFIRNSRSQAMMMGVNNPADVTGKTDFDFFPKNHAQRSYNEEQDLVQSGQPILDIEEEVLWPDGHITWVSTTKMPLRDAEGQVIGTFGISRDVTERKLAEEELQRSYTQLEAANKELEAFSYSVSHDLRAPLRTIDGFSKAVMEDYGDVLPEEGRNDLARVRKAAQYMAQLIDDMLNLSRVTRAPMKSETVNLSKIAQGIIAELQHTQPERKVNFTSKPNLNVHGDLHLLQVVLENLLNNAWKFTSKREQAEIELGLKRENQETIYFVRDNGAGFDMAYTNKLFGAFQRLHAMTDFPGTGVGLATVQRIIHRHGGRIWAEAEVDHGATFFFILPARERPKPGGKSQGKDSVIKRAREII